jgi:hypothetical protein
VTSRTRSTLPPASSNEAFLATKAIKAAVSTDPAAPGAEIDAAWCEGRDALNSFLTIANRAIVPKVGEKFLSV